MDRFEKPTKAVRPLRSTEQWEWTHRGDARLAETQLCQEVWAAVLREQGHPGGAAQSSHTLVFCLQCLSLSGLLE